MSTTTATVASTMTANLAKNMVSEGLFTVAMIHACDGGYMLYLKASQKHKWTAVATARDPYSPRVYKSADGAISGLLETGLTEAQFVF